MGFPILVRWCISTESGIHSHYKGTTEGLYHKKSYNGKMTSLYYILSIYHDHILHKNTHSPTVTMVKLRSNFALTNGTLYLTLTDVLWQCLSWVIQRKMTAIYRQHTVLYWNNPLAALHHSRSATKMSKSHKANSRACACKLNTNLYTDSYCQSEKSKLHMQQLLIIQSFFSGV